MKSYAWKLRACWQKGCKLAEGKVIAHGFIETDMTDQLSEDKKETGQVLV